MSYRIFESIAIVRQNRIINQNNQYYINIGNVYFHKNNDKALENKQRFGYKKK